VNSFYSAGDKAQVLSNAAKWCELDYRNALEARGAGAAVLRIERAGRAHGLLLWFDGETIAGCGFSNAPGVNPASVYGQLLFSWPEPVMLNAGDEVEVELHADPVGEDYVWRWNTTIRSRGKVSKQFRQSTFFSSPIRAETLPLRSADHRPELNDDGIVERFILERTDGSRSVQAIAHELQSRFPQRFADERKALNLVSDVSVHFSRRNGR